MNLVIINGRNFLDPHKLAAAGFYYLGVGRPTTGNSFVTKKIQQTNSTKQTKAA